jgi:DNA-binding XRE family transcriptional regulator
MRFYLATAPRVPRFSQKAHQYALEPAMTPKEIGQKIRTRRKLLRLRQRDLAELAGVTLRGLTDLENGQANPTLKQLGKIADVLGLEFNLIERSRHASS